ncbi:MAG: histone deacetylase family protein [bacterium]
MDIVYGPECLNYRKIGHPETPQRVEQAVSFLQKEGYNFLQPESCSKKELQLVHSSSHIKDVEQNNFFDPDCPNYEKIHEYASLATGGALKAAQIHGFSLMRPPGHHAGADYVKGFCYYNHIAVAVEKMNQKTLIIDIDGHHGNGTQDIFLGREDIVYISLHKDIFPGTGHVSQKNCYNYVFDNYPGDDQYLSVLRELVERVLTEYDYDFEIAAVSAGFDAFKEDPLANLGITQEGYYEIGKLISELDLPVFCVLEGGYNVKKLGINIHSFITGLES